MPETSQNEAQAGATKPMKPWIDRGTILFAVLALVTGLACWWLKGEEVTLGSALGTLELLATVAPILVVALIMAGYLEQLLPRDAVAHWLGGKSGFKGLAIASIAGAITPGGPFAAFPLVLALSRAGADIGTLVAYITAWSVLAMHRVVLWELPLIGPDFAIMRFVVSLPLPFVAGGLARVFWNRFPLDRNRDR